MYQKGYKDDPANIAYEAISQATKQSIDVVLIDTAGRMENNEPLMKALSKLININKPNLILFIGEAITGNQGVEQFKKFNSSIKENSAKKDKEIDGIILTKFDAV